MRKQHENGWTLSTLKEYVDIRFNNAREIADLKVTHLRELREADQRALELERKNNDMHFGHLNENAKRTIEERSHFVPNEAFLPFKEIVLKFIDTSVGKRSGLSLGWAVLIGAVTLIGGALGIYALLAT